MRFVCILKPNQTRSNISVAGQGRVVRRVARCKQFDAQMMPMTGKITHIHTHPPGTRLQGLGRNLET